MTDEQTIAAYFAAFNADNPQGMLALVAEDIEHHVNQGGVRHGKTAFAEFLAMMQQAYREEARDLVILSGPSGRMAAEFTIHGTYLQTQQGCPVAHGQGYVLPVGSFFALRYGKITRVTTCYNVPDWVAQVS